MTLHLSLRVNGVDINHHLTMQRLTPKKPVPADSTICTYKVTHIEGRGVGISTHHVTEVSHRYGDGPMELVRKALNALHDDTETK